MVDELRKGRLGEAVWLPDDSMFLLGLRGELTDIHTERSCPA